MKVKLGTMDVHFKAIMEQETFKEAYHPGHEGVGPVTCSWVLDVKLHLGVDELWDNFLVNQNID